MYILFWVVIAICGVFTVYRVLDDYFTYRRLDKYADELIADQSMDREEWIMNMRWEYRNCSEFCMRSILWSRQYSHLCDKLMSALEYEGKQILAKKEE